MASRSGHSYSDIHNSGASRNHLGDVYNQYGPSPDQQAFRAVLDSLRYDGMDDRTDRLNSAEAGTFEWALAGRDGDGGVLDTDDARGEDGQEDDEDNGFYDEGGESGSNSDDDEGHKDDEDNQRYNEGGELGSDSDDEEGSRDEDSDEESEDEGDLWQSTKTIDRAFTDWLVSDEGERNLFCFMGKPGSGKSTLMYAFSKDKTAGRCTMH